MRAEIDGFLEQVRARRKQMEIWGEQNAQPDDSQAYAFRSIPEDHPLQIELTRQFNIMVDNCDRLKACIEMLPNILSIHISSTTSLEVHTNAAIESEIIIDFSIGGPFIDVSVYGIVTDATLQLSAGCIQACGLVQITDDERQELEEMGSYHDLFP